MRVIRVRANVVWFSFANIFKDKVKSIFALENLLEKIDELFSVMFSKINVLLLSKLGIIGLVEATIL